MIETQYLFLDVPTMRRLIVEREKTDRYRTDEMLVAIALCKFGEQSWGQECAAGFPLKDKEVASVPMVGSSDMDDLKREMNTKLEQAHDVDALIVKHTPENSKRSGQAFQIKYFNTYQPDLTTEGLIAYLKSLKYPKTDTALVVLLATGEPTVFTKVRDSIDFEKFPFSSLFFVGLYGQTVRLVQVWPQLGKSEVEWQSL